MLCSIRSWLHKNILDLIVFTSVNGRCLNVFEYSLCEPDWEDINMMDCVKDYIHFCMEVCPEKANMMNFSLERLVLFHIRPQDFSGSPAVFL